MSCEGEIECKIDAGINEHVQTIAMFCDNLHEESSDAS
jgi:hypothetical protein